MAVNFIFLLTLTVVVDSLKLEQVLIISRHNIRAPLVQNLQRLSALEWPPWDEPAGHLTEKGGLLEDKMGGYFSQWFRSKGLFSDECPEPDSVYIYANALNRTIETAKKFSRSAFPNCNISVHYKPNKNDNVVLRDPVFFPLLANSSETFKEAYFRCMKEKLNQLRLEETYAMLSEIVDLSSSDICKHEYFCDFNLKKDDILFVIGDEPSINGPLLLGSHIVDYFLMSYYNGRADDDIAWGKIKTDKEWKQLLDITREFQNVRFNHYVVAKDVSRPLINLMRNTLMNEKMARKLTFLVGHDSTQTSLMAALRFKKYNLTGQYEMTPVGGKLVFQKWRDENSSKLFLKIEYVYESMKQLRDGAELTAENPPFTKVMELQNCEIDKNGYCPWDDFVNILDNVY